MLKYLKRLLFLGSFLFFFITSSATPIKPNNVSAELLLEYEVIEPGKSFWAGILFKMDPGWHIYWKNPGEAGLPVEIEWILPEGMYAEETQWPKPEISTNLNLINFLYSDYVLLLTRIKNTNENQKNHDTVTLSANLNWLECSDICIPSNGSISQTMRIGLHNHRSAQIKNLFEETLDKIPPKLDIWEGIAFANRSEDIIKIELKSAIYDDLEKLRDITFLPEDQIFDLTEDPEIEYTTNGISLKLTLDINSDDPLPQSINGILTTEDTWDPNKDIKDMSIEVPLAEVATSLIMSSNVLDSKFNVSRSLIFAFIGGLILNLMPCVFPVIGIKIISFIEKAHESRLRIFIHGLSFTFGILISFWTLSGILILLRQSGEHIGWGFQLQSPLFVSFLIVLFFIMSLNFLGLFEIGSNLGESGSKLTKGSGYSSSFFTGVFATVVATPCTAPFMGTALGFALSQSPFIAFQVFTSLGLGMSLPYILLSLFPSLLQKLPRPGKWMIIFKQILAIPLLLTVAWMIWIFERQTTSSMLIPVLFGLILITSACYIYGKWGNVQQVLITRKKSYLLSALFLIAGIFFICFNMKSTQPINHQYREKYGLPWHAFTPTIVDEFRQKGHPVFLDFTADWCLSCQFNGNLTFSSTRVLEKIQELRMTLIEADWTLRNPIITKELEKYGRSGVPFYLLFPSNMEQNPIVLPTILTPAIFLEYVELMEKASE